ncbi:hypothetical protein ACTG9Q_12875 [Actinokineospora sp. 24-640]
MTDRDARPAPVSALRRLATDPRAPLAVLAAAGVGLGVVGWSAAVWPVLGGLAGYTLSGSV